MDEDLTRETVIQRIKSALERRSGKKWSVTGGRGTTRGWLKISSPPQRRDRYGRMTPEDRAGLAALLGVSPARIRPDYESIPDQDDYYREYIDRAEGREPRVRGKPDWD
jgi:hypothetical protein